MNPTPLIRLVTLAPGHFHAALVHKEQLPGVDANTKVFAPLDGDLLTHLERVRRFNERETKPTAWNVTAYAGRDWLEQFQHDDWGTVAVIAGQNRPKIELIRAAVERGLHVLADKPMVIDAADLSQLQKVMETAERRGLLVRDIMTERHEATSLLQRSLMQDREVFGEALAGTVEEPALELESVHYLAKHVAGVPLVRPTWWYDPLIAGTAPADVGTHLADLAMWLLFPDEAITSSDIEVLEVRLWPTLVPVQAFLENTAQREVPESLRRLVRTEGTLEYSGNGTITYRLRGHVVRWTVRWDVGPDAVGDTHFAHARGTKADVIVQHDLSYGNGPQVFVQPKSGERYHVAVSDAERHGHEAHFAAVLGDFIEQIRDPSKVPAWETSNLLAKYVATTRAGVLRN